MIDPCLTDRLNHPLDCLKIYCEAGVPLTFGSDAHKPEEVGKNFDRAMDLAKSAGYSEYLIFKKRQIEKKIRI